MVRSPHRRKAPAFSLLELLVVMAIIGLLAAFALPGLSSLTQSRTVSDAAYQLVGAAEIARNEAVGRRTYVWLGIQPVEEIGESSVDVGLVFSRDGTADLSPDNLQALGRVTRMARLGLVSPSVPPVPADDLTFATSGASFSLGGTDFDRIILAFSPTGEILASPTPGPDDGFSPRSGIGLRTMRGGVPDNNNPVDVVFDGSTGIASIQRP